MASINQILRPLAEHSCSHCRSSFKQKQHLLCHMRNFQPDKVGWWKVGMQTQSCKVNRRDNRTFFTRTCEFQAKSLVYSLYSVWMTITASRWISLKNWAKSLRRVEVFLYCSLTRSLYSCVSLKGNAFFSTFLYLLSLIDSLGERTKIYSWWYEQLCLRIVNNIAEGFLLFVRLVEM